MLRFEDGSMVRKSKPQPEDRHKITYYFRNEPPSRTCERLFFLLQRKLLSYKLPMISLCSIRLFMLLWCVRATRLEEIRIRILLQNGVMLFFHL